MPSKKTNYFNSFTSMILEKGEEEEDGERREAVLGRGDVDTQCP